MTITVVPSAVTGQTYSAANYNTQVRDNINGIWVLTTAGDMLYATGASAAARLALVVGGVMYGAASAPAWLAIPSVTSILKKTADTDPPTWQALAGFPGRLHKVGSDYTDSLATSVSTSYATTDVKFNLSLDYACKIVAIAVGSCYKNVGSTDGLINIKINGSFDSSEPIAIRNTEHSSFAIISIVASVPSGTREVDLQFKTDNAGDALYISRAVLYALAFVED